MNSNESPTIMRRLGRLGRAMGKPLVLRGVRLWDTSFRGRILEKPDRIILEYRDDTAGYFWHYEIIEELLDHVAQNHTDVVLHEGDIRHADASSNDISEVIASEE